MITFNAPNVWATSDPHFWHGGIISKCGRPFTSIGHMNDTLRHRWNAAVGDEDLVICLGDMFMGQPCNWVPMLKSLNGRKVLIRGNHDRSPKHYADGFEAYYRNEILLLNGVRCWVNHYPYGNVREDGTHRRPPAPGDYDIALCGHVHERWKHKAGLINVGVDVWDFAPVALDQLVTYHKTLQAA